MAGLSDRGFVLPVIRLTSLGTVGKWVSAHEGKQPKSTDRKVACSWLLPRNGGEGAVTMQKPGRWGIFYRYSINRYSIIRRSLNSNALYKMAGRTRLTGLNASLKVLSAPIYLSFPNL